MPSANRHHADALARICLRLLCLGEDEQKSKNVWLKGHTAGQQILSPKGWWKWVKHIENALVINIGDALEFLSGGIYKATILHVVQPPPSQHGYTRLGVFYFAVFDDDVVLKPLEESPGIKREGVLSERLPERGQEPTMDEDRKARIRAYDT
ncbi:hypothetical protein OE88DRAFT_1649072 [Heliocybe sulcata]|uniref:Isopenicillin N synthase-like Fe(2+) 2OG dioxygenase domain-containing protein n=1 Tax=Heliocybe sulcata TaxID=5364 RepID=A0A5C3MWE4_9AGAM|nr:hypothetical protein OE88DRAFT_1649072 [Heliocybe sulcata]